MSDRLGIGGNSPPGMAETALEVVSSVNAWLTEHPVIEDADQARESKKQIDRLKLATKDLEEERTSKVSPLNDQVATINDTYRKPRTLMQAVLDELNKRLGVFICAEELKRRKEADEAHRKMQEAERIAREAEATEANVIADAETGVEGDLLKATQEADEAFADFKRASRIAARAEKDTKVRIGGGLTGRVLAFRSYETLNVTDWHEAISMMGLTEDIKEAICKSARAYRKLKGKLPPGVEAEVEKAL